MTWPISFRDVLEARLRLAPYLPVTPLRGYPVLDRELGMSVLIKHENHQPTGSFKARNALSVLTRLGPEERDPGPIHLEQDLERIGLDHGTAHHPGSGHDHLFFGASQLDPGRRPLSEKL